MLQMKKLNIDDLKQAYSDEMTLRQFQGDLAGMVVMAHSGLPTPKKRW